MPNFARRPFLSRSQALVLIGAFVVHFLLSLTVPSRPYFVATWHMVLAAAVLISALAALAGWAWARFSVPARAQERWRAAFWLLWLVLTGSLAPAVYLHLSQSNYGPLLRLLSTIVVPAVVVYVLLHLAKVLPQNAPDSEPDNPGA
ncbi:MULTISPECIES: hypothetical protein [unclassified Acidovorax]|uniref:hypothetical protein n=1 Tax=unclassified Acidovorax TaxID=2684926 RepID=UPI0012E1B4B7|nr:MULTISPECIES: hypothetical protein [unclassified Acidovorax]